MTDPLALIHYTPRSFMLNRARVYKQEVDFKPRGLWLSVGRAWEDWCRGEDWGVSTLTHRTGVTFAAGANVLTLSTVEGIDKFTAEHCVPIIHDGRPVDVDFVDWPTLATLYDGIIIAPYQHQRRLSLPWYYPWDCASGCVWNLDVIMVRVSPSTPGG